VVWDWSVYYTFLVQSIIDGSFTTRPWFGSLADGVVDLSPLSDIIFWEPETIRILEEERWRIETGVFQIFEGIMETNDGRLIGREGERLSDREIQFGIDWYYRNVRE
jgi:basic membrane protein A